MHQMQARLYARLQAECDAHIGTQLDALQGHTRLPPTAFLEQVWGGGGWCHTAASTTRITAAGAARAPPRCSSSSTWTTAMQHGLLIQGSDGDDDGYDSEAAP